MKIKRTRNVSIAHKEVREEKGKVLDLGEATVDMSEQMLDLQEVLVSVYEQKNTSTGSIL